MHKITTRRLAIYLFLFMAVAIIRVDAQQRPNVLLIMADDMGYSDIGCYGGEIQTPNIDKLAANGLRFKQFYNTARCCPTRASMLTGLYPHQTGIGGMVGGNSKIPAYAGDLNNQCVTIAEALGENGYKTYMTGKWHISKSTSPKDKHNWPIQRGFDKFYGTIMGSGSYFDPNTLTYNNNAVSISTKDDFYYTNAISDSTVTFLQNHSQKNPDQPFFFYVAYTAPHWPLHALENDIQRYDGVYSKGWDKLRKERIRRMEQMGLINKEWELSEPSPDIPSWQDVENKDWEIQRMKTYAAQIDAMDQGIGKIIDHLKRNNLLDDTIILFLSDNGGAAEIFDSSTEWVRRKGPKTTLEGAKLTYGNDTDLMAGTPDTFMSYGKPWANLSNTPFRYYKTYGYEGGVATPFIVHWPKGFSEKNKFRDEVSEQRVPFELKKGETLQLDIFIDKAIIEVFANGRECITQVVYPEMEDSNKVKIFSVDEKIKVKSVEVWKMASTNFY